MVTQCLLPLRATGQRSTVQEQMQHWRRGSERRKQLVNPYIYQLHIKTASNVSTLAPSTSKNPTTWRPISSVAQRWTKWKKGFKYFMKASGITKDCRKRALLLLAFYLFLNRS